MIYLIFDSHAHYDDKAFDNDRDDLLKSLPNKGIYEVINAGTNIQTSRESVRLANKYSYIYAAVGIHPECILDNCEKNLQELESMVSNELERKNKKIVAIGEIGLDYHYSKENKDLQLEIFEKQIIIAKKLDIPVLIHDRDAHKDIMDMLLKYKPRGVVHCFSGSIEMAREILKMGMFLGIGGAVTFKNSKKLVQTVENVSLESILLETDCPYMAPTPFRGSRCDSSHIKFVAQKISEIKNIPYSTVLFQTRQNALKLFDLEKVV